MQNRMIAFGYRLAAPPARHSRIFAWAIRCCLAAMTAVIAVGLIANGS